MTMNGLPRWLGCVCVRERECDLPASSVYGIFQATILELVAILFSRESFQSRDQIWVSCIAGRFFTV